jgi:putative transposase
MARLKRYHNPGSHYHVMLRGNDGQDIFFSEIDRYILCFLLQEGVERYGHRIHAFCFMINHIHLLIQVAEIPLSKIMHNLTFRYSQKINYKYKKIGHLFQGRFKAILVDEGAYFKRLLRYIHLNPIRANIVKTPENYRWSSHNVYLGQNEISWLTCDYGLLKFGKAIEEARTLYCTYTSKGESNEELAELRSNFKDGQVLGEDTFLSEIRKVNSIEMDSKLSLTSILMAVCNVLEIREDQILSASKSQSASYARGIVASIAKREKISLEEIAKLMGRDGSTISSLVSRFSLRYNSCSETANLLKKAIKKAKHIAELQV